jgi:hypothetical protein
MEMWELTISPVSVMRCFQDWVSGQADISILISLRAALREPARAGMVYGTMRERWNSKISGEHGHLSKQRYQRYVGRVRVQEEHQALGFQQLFLKTRSLEASQKTTPVHPANTYSPHKHIRFRAVRLYVVPQSRQIRQLSATADVVSCRGKATLLA